MYIPLSTVLVFADEQQIPVLICGTGVLPAYFRKCAKNNLADLQHMEGVMSHDHSWAYCSNFFNTPNSIAAICPIVVV